MILETLINADSDEFKKNKAKHNRGANCNFTFFVYWFLLIKKIMQKNKVKVC